MSLDWLFIALVVDRVLYGSLSMRRIPLSQSYLEERIEKRMFFLGAARLQLPGNEFAAPGLYHHHHAMQMTSVMPHKIHPKVDHPMKLTHLSSVRGLRLSIWRLIAVTFCLMTASTSWAADELPAVTAPSKLHWIWAEQVDDKADTVVFEKTFALGKKPTGGRIRVMANAGCAVTINGEVVGDQTDLKRPKELPLKNQLVAGENKIRIEAKRGATSDALVMSMFVTEADGLRRRLETDGSWLVVPANGKGVAAKQLHAYADSPWGRNLTKQRKRLH